MGLSLWGADISPTLRSTGPSWAKGFHQPGTEITHLRWEFGMLSHLLAKTKLLMQQVSRLCSHQAG